MNYIELKDMIFYAYHGVMEQERIVGNTYSVSIRLYLDLARAMESDNLEDTVNYAAVYEIIRKEMEIPSCLIEHVAGRILKSVKAHFPQVREISVRLSKNNPPIGASIREAAVEING